MNNIKVSIIIPTYNREDYVVFALESALKQNYSNIEIIVSDNNSEDNTLSLLEKYKTDPRVSVYRNETNLGMIGNWQKCIYEYMTGDYFILLSDDDYFCDDNYISKAVDLLEQNKKVVAVYAAGYVLYEDTGKLKDFVLPYTEVVEGSVVIKNWGTLKPFDAILCNILFNKSLAISLNAFKNNNNITADTKLFLEMCSIGEIGVIPVASSVYRIHKSNLIKSIRKNYLFTVANVSSYIDPYNRVIASNIISMKEMEGFLKRCIFNTFKLAIRSLIYAPKKERIENMNFLVKEYNGIFSKLINADCYVRIIFCLIVNANYINKLIEGIRFCIEYPLKKIKRFTMVMLKIN